MNELIKPEGYNAKLNIRETEVAIKKLRVFFEEALSKNLNLTRVSAPLYVRPETGLNDDLNEVERPVSFDILEQKGVVVEIVHSLAKWKRFALNRYKFEKGEGLYTNMNAIRRDEYTDNIHSLYVDQWDWEKVISKEERNFENLKATVEAIYSSIKLAEDYITGEYKVLNKFLPDFITFITSQEMEDEKPELSPKEREDYFAKKYGAIFISQIGGALKSGKPHDGRAPDYDDWSLNGDIVVYNPILESSFELSSMGIRVDEISLLNQLTAANKLNKKSLPFQKSVLEGALPYTIGGGIGQSRLCMLLLNKAHIGEVQVSIWPKETEDECKKAGINLL